MFRELELEKKARIILGVSIGADLVQIRRVYWRLAMEYHPDKNPKDPSLAEKFKVISQAYEILVVTC